jgi:hypothetical protein
MLVDDVAGAFAERGVELTVRLLPEDEAGPPAVLLSGKSDALRMLGMLLLAVAEEAPPDDGFGIDPRGPGSLLFSKEATHGIYIHKIPAT